jgi:hypothetical protein
MTISELYNAINSENPHFPVIRMLEGVEIFENYLNAGMIARFISAQHDGDDVIRFDLVVTEFDEFNTQFEHNNYYDKHGVPCLTARESDNYLESFPVFVDLDLDIDDVFELVSSETVKELNDPFKTFQNALRAAQSKRPSVYSSYSLETVDSLAVFLFMKGDNVSPLAIATRGCLEALSDKGKN